tara:strand:- start:94 stop:735 length:642 start_codon:yes stop_codon:yes gene_type:complete
LARRLSLHEKKEIVMSFSNGKSIDELSLTYNCTKLTISRNLKKSLGEKRYKELNTNNKKSSLDFSGDTTLVNKNESFQSTDYKTCEKEYFPNTEFTEIKPLNYEFDDSKQKDLSSVPIEEVEWPKVVYMIVDKKIELETKFLKDYPDWQFLSQDELNRKTIELHFDLKNAKRLCGKEQKVLKVPNTEVFKIVAPLLLSRGISRIVTSEKLISL